MNIWRHLLYAYLWVFGTLLWLAWAMIQTAAKGNLRHNPMALDDPAEEGESVGNCVAWGLMRFIRHGGELHLLSSPRLPVWRIEWSSPDGRRWHFEPTNPRAGVRGVWHSFWHRGRPKAIKARSRR